MIEKATPSIELSKLEVLLNTIKENRYYTQDLLSSLHFTCNKLEALDLSREEMTVPTKDTEALIDKLNEEVNLQKNNNIQLGMLLNHLQKTI